jgi:hypothetical protein
VHFTSSKFDMLHRAWNKTCRAFSLRPFLKKLKNKACTSAQAANPGTAKIMTTKLPAESSADSLRNSGSPPPSLVPVPNLVVVAEEGSPWGYINVLVCGSNVSSHLRKIIFPMLLPTFHLYRIFHQLEDLYENGCASIHCVDLSMQRTTVIEALGVLDSPADLCDLLTTHGMVFRPGFLEEDIKSLFGKEDNDHIRLIVLPQEYNNSLSSHISLQSWEVTQDRLRRFELLEIKLGLRRKSPMDCNMNHSQLVFDRFQQEMYCRLANKLDELECLLPQIENCLNMLNGILKSLEKSVLDIQKRQALASQIKERNESCGKPSEM